MKKYTILALALFATPLMAHPGHGVETGGFVAGLLHPLTGVDHLVVMLGFGLLAAALERKSALKLGALVVGGMVAGAFLGSAFGASPAVEIAILASIVLVAGLFVFRNKVALPAVLAVAAVIGAVHGIAHGNEAGSLFMPFVAGMAVMASALIGVSALAIRATRILAPAKAA